MTRRRRFVWVAAILVVVTLLMPAIAGAEPDPTSATQGPNSALSWTDVRDSNGVPLSNYMFVTSDGSILNPLRTMLALVLQLLFVVWLVVVTLAIWVIGFALSFGWLDLFADVLLGTAKLFAGQVATTIVLITAATLGAFFVSYFVVRGFYAKATMQVVTMLAVAVFGVIFLAHPLAELLGPDGLLAKGRDLGVSIAAGLHGNSNPDPDNVVATMQASLVDNFARKPLQVWNFGHVIDDQCGSAWSSGMMSGDSNHVKSALNACDAEAFAAAEQPTFGQVGTGLVLFVCGLILVWFAVRLGLKVIRTALNAVYHGFMSILGFAAGGYVYGPTQTFLIRNLVDTAFAAFGMAAYTVFLAIYVLVLGDVFQQARGQVMPVLVLGAIVMLIATRQMLNLRASLESGGEWVANRFALATQAAGGGGVGGAGERALGMGGGTASAMQSDLSSLTALTAMNTVASFAANPLVAWAWRGSANPLNRPYMWQESLAFRREGYDAIVRDHLHHREWQPGTPPSGRALAGLANYWFNNGLPLDYLVSSLRSVANVQPEELDEVIAAESYVKNNIPDLALRIPASAWVSGGNFRILAGTPDADAALRDRAFEAAGVHARNLFHYAGTPRRALTKDEEFQVAYIKTFAHSEQELFTATDKAFWHGLGRNARHTLQRDFAKELWDAHHDLRTDKSQEAHERYYLAIDRVQNLHNAARMYDALVNPWQR